MSGPIVVGSSWGRRALAQIPPDERAAIEAAIPDGCHITVMARTAPGDWSVRLFRGHVEVQVVYHARSFAGGCWAVIRAEESANVA